MFAFCLPFLLAILLFPCILIPVVRRVKGRKFTDFQSKLRAPKVLDFLTNLLRVNAFLLGIGSNVVALVYGRFENEFIRVSIKAAVALFTFYADQHWVLRVGSLTLNFLSIVFMEYYYMRESLLQAACF